MTGVYYHEREQCDVYVTSGEYSIDGRISNYYTYHRIKRNGTLGKQKAGYGGLSPAKNKYEIITRILILN